ncbi:MAG: hypothetical protein ACC661_10640, partial [Verrucomicrobiales bacterium]
PGSAGVHLATARLLSHGVDPMEAGGHYEKAVEADPAMRDAELEDWFENVAGLCVEIDCGEEDSNEKREEEVQPITLQEISSLRDRRDSVSKKAPAVIVPPPSLAPVENEETAADVAPAEHYAIEDLKSAPIQAVAPPPDIQQVEEDVAVVQADALEQTGLVASNAFTIADIKELQGPNSHTREKVSAMGVAVLVHVIVFFVLGLIVIAVPRSTPPQIVAVAMPSDEVVPELEKKEILKITKPNPSSASRVSVVTSANTSSVSVPMLIEPIDNLDPIGAGADFGMAMSFSGQGAGNVSFFGSQTKANKVVFVVDWSASMNQRGRGISKFELMKQELSKTVKGLSSGVQFQIICFSGPVWYIGDDPPNSRDKSDDWHEWDKNGKTLNFWHYKDGEVESLPVGKYLQATPGTIRKVIKQIEESKPTYGTDWREPLRMAVKMEPDVIYFMTDGAVGRHPEKPDVVKTVLDYNRSMSRAKINSICLMVPRATEDLRTLAEKTRGEFTLVLEDGTALRGKDLEEYERNNKGKGKGK